MIALLINLICPIPKIINKTNLPWTQNDQKIVVSAKKRCKQQYSSSPCLKIFTKIDYNTYRVICGK